MAAQSCHGPRGWRAGRSVTLLTCACEQTPGVTVSVHCILRSGVRGDQSEFDCDLFFLFRMEMLAGGLWYTRSSSSVTAQRSEGNAGGLDALRWEVFPKHGPRYTLTAGSSPGCASLTHAGRVPAVLSHCSEKFSRPVWPMLPRAMKA